MALAASLPLPHTAATDGLCRAPGTAASRLASSFATPRGVSGRIALLPRAAFRGMGSGKGAAEGRERSAAAAAAVTSAGAGGAAGEAVGVNRRAVLIGSGVLTGAALCSPGHVARATDVAPQRYFKTASGATVEEVYEGQGEAAAAAGDAVTVHYVCRRSNGYFVASTIDPVGGEAEPIDLLLGQGQVIQGLEEAVQGMRAGGKRRVLIPPALGYVRADMQPQPKEYFRQRALAAHVKEPLIFEVQVVKLRPGAAAAAL
ncbi:hypothetical protein CLOP_g17244 [Closterium sp. NIES-67]|nr:hypothetical protein CLOP_g17244 [Closterium sp. NIES-67]